jgi:hypothetical protein
MTRRTLWMASVGALSMMLGCHTRPCEPGTLFLQLSGDAVSGATQLATEVNVDGAIVRSDLAFSGVTPASATLSFASGYPQGKTVMVTATALAGGDAVARGTATVQLVADCAAVPITLVAIPPTPAALPFPRTMGVSLANKNYDDVTMQRKLAALDVLVVGFYKNWRGDPTGMAMRAAVQQMRALNPQLLIAQYSLLDQQSPDTTDDTSGDIAQKLNDTNWWLRNAAGQMVQTSVMYNDWAVNISQSVAPDAKGQRFPEWYADRMYQQVFKPVPQLTAWYLAVVDAQPRDTVVGDWDLDGKDDPPASVGAAYRAGQRAEWDHIRAIHPGAVLFAELGNHDASAPEYVGVLDGAFLDAMMGKDYSLETYAGWQTMMARYRAVMANTRAPHLVGFDVRGAIDDYRAMRYGLTSALMDDGYFSYSDLNSGTTWGKSYDELNVDLGRAIDPPPTVAYQDQVYLRRFEHGLAVVNSSKDTAAVVDMPMGYRRITGTQAPTVNTGEAVTTLTIAPRDGYVLVAQ